MWVFVEDAYAHSGMLWFNYEGRLHAALPEDVLQLYIIKRVHIQLHPDWVNRYQEVAST